MAITRFTGPVMTGTQWFSDGVSTVNGGRNVGMAVLSQVSRFNFNAANGGTNTYQVINLPDDAQITRMYIDVTTAFAGSTATNVSIGVLGTATWFTNASDLQGGGTRFELVPATALQATHWTDVGVGENNLPLMITVAQTGGTPTAGAAFFTVQYVQWPQTGTTN